VIETAWGEAYSNRRQVPNRPLCHTQPTLRSRALFLAPILLAGALRLPDLAARPMHADEAVHADKFGTLLETGGYVYDPSEYHGPSLYYLTLPSAWLRGQQRYVEIDEITLRVVPAAIGVALVALHVGARGLLGPAGALAAAFLAALSPAFVFYGRYFIHEVPLVFFSFGAILAVSRYARRPGPGPALAAGACIGLMVATKETAPIAVGCLAAAIVATRLRGPGPAAVLADRRPGGVIPQALAALLAAAVVMGLLFSSFLTNPRGIVDAVRAYGLYLDRAGAASLHFHAWDYYLRLLVHFPSSGTPVWTEGLILVLAAAGGAAAWRATPASGADPWFLRVVGLYTLLMLGVYSAIPYKTPWCLLGFLHGLILLAGAGAVALVRAFARPSARILVGLLLAAATAHLGWQAFAGSFRFAADPRNPYVYAHTTADVFEIAGRLSALARAQPEGLALPVQVFSRENLWPLPFYLRRFSRVGWWNGVPDAGAAAPLILATPDMEPALVRKLYDLPPPGQRELYLSLFERPMELRPGVEVRGYARNSLRPAGP
jgi:uncharacterized protein (TIGR03663 family)